MIMKQAKNISFTLVAPSDGLWGGTCYSSNNCSGMIGMVNRKEVDMALGTNFCLLSGLHTFDADSLM